MAEWVDAVRARLADAPDIAAAVPRAIAASRFLDAALQALTAADDALGDFTRAYADGETRRRVDAVLEGVDTPDSAMAALRRLRRRQMARIALRDLSGAAPLDETLHDLSDLADACVAAALGFVERRLQARHGVPRTADGVPIRPVVLGMGKLGGRELNFSSDIDLIFCHTDSGETDGARALSSDEYFAKLAQETTRLLLAQTADGFVFRVDTMLRPFGSAGALSASFPALEDYYQVHGREWERYAMIKARPVAGDLAAGERLLTLLRPFVYRRYLDYNAIGALRGLKRLIEDEVARKGLDDNIKLGAGGIREIEFIVQSFQLVRGGAEEPLRDHRLRPVLRYLGEQGYLDAGTASRLDEAYVFLRRVENAIQMYADQQTHALPEHEAAREALLCAMGSRDWATLQSRLNEVRAYVREQFMLVFAADEDDEGSASHKLVAALWSGTLTGDAALEALYSAGFRARPQAVLAGIEALRTVRLVRAMREATARRLLQLLARLVDESAAQADPETALVRTLRVIEAIAGRSNYLTLLRESDAARTALLRLCRASPWLTDFIARSPIVLDSLLDARTLYAPPDRDELVDELQRRAAPLQPPADTEQAMNLLRHYQREMTLRVAAADLVEALPLVQVSDRLTWLAEVIVAQALRFAWTEMQAQYGEPRRTDGACTGFAVIAYGKFGGIELGYGSDLDLVFLHDCDQLDADSVGGTRSIDNGTWMARLAQRLINWLATQTPAGRAYEVDMELRPNGRSGLLVSSVDSFGAYQQEDAWTWEHQALTRARWVAGDERIGRHFGQIRREVLMRARDGDRLREDIVGMRRRMRGELDKSNDACWDIKQGEGGLIDIEFITQYLVLRDAHRNEAIVSFSDNWRQLDALARAGSIAVADRDALIDSYRRYRAWAHERSLQQADGLAPAGAFAEPRACVRQLWQTILGD
ncbi:bifunctional [glutamate--ammonia ligase]-adenylyl-L-tyrosine phosphorylase/[glutamate--ammonia-ligase] adenylyltransferase [Sinimarinibacterium flocculans]|uniref:Bifunctional glutamine synthetase adenylyltransferase/adenylyl-removing enzyme n=1 Tax=Sinimarinibacterium flocculans TaxID=985250 RepID=A0A318EE20_9GAMM|nr:bifunctional [glutamate--ammonia ligase]-adenylyl-L-tyrosine phosphorylase/[glutamate--ammonia-ligase] adenylyltransferase [Sinimarinibacterium flocculans]PXV71019.1 glutamate-ammonia-ligase adenylyltransferase [Sinimarinibacterium flocculans]